MPLADEAAAQWSTCTLPPVVVPGACSLAASSAGRCRVLLGTPRPGRGTYWGCPAVPPGSTVSEICLMPFKVYDGCAAIELEAACLVRQHKAAIGDLPTAISSCACAAATDALAVKHDDVVGVRPAHTSSRSATTTPSDARLLTLQHQSKALFSCAKCALTRIHHQSLFDPQYGRADRLHIA